MAYLVIALLVALLAGILWIGYWYVTRAGDALSKLWRRK